MARILQDGAEMGVPSSTPNRFSYADSQWWCYHRVWGTIGSDSGNFRSTTEDVNSGERAFDVGRTSSRTGSIAVRADLGENKSEVYGRVEYKTDHPAEDDPLYFVAMLDEAGDTGLMIGVDNVTDLVVRIGDEEIGRAYGVIINGVYNRIEWHLVVGTSGQVNIRVNGVPVLTHHGNTQGDRMSTVRYLGIGGWAWDEGYSRYSYGHSSRMDDIAVNDTSGSVNNSWCGKGSIILQKPKGAGHHTDYDPVNGAENWENVAVYPYDGDDTYNEADEAEKTDTYKMEGLMEDQNVDPEATVKSVQVNFTARYHESDAHIAPMLRQDEEDHEGDKVIMAGQYYRQFFQLFDTNPVKEQPWEMDDLDDIEAGVRQKEHTDF